MSELSGRPSAAMYGLLGPLPQFAQTRNCFVRMWTEYSALTRPAGIKVHELPFPLATTSPLIFSDPLSSIAEDIERGRL